tara:strand:+ start:2233 stop:2508 length:276 start_codon:yes stop_codon:yes gene_type:complete
MENNKWVKLYTTDDNQTLVTISKFTHYIEDKNGKLEKEITYLVQESVTIDGDKLSNNILDVTNLKKAQKVFDDYTITDAVRFVASRTNNKK